MNRRDVLRRGVVAGGSVLAFPYPAREARGAAPAAPSLAAVRNGEPGAMFDRAMEALGGLGRFVTRGQTVVVKPNIGWPRGPETGANTNPELVHRIVTRCREAGAAKVYVLDHTVGERRDRCYAMSGIEAAAKDAGAVVAPGSDERHYQPVEIAGAERLPRVAVHELVLEADVLINVPVLKHHKSARASIAMKNLMGVVWDRGAYHKQGLQDCIADFCTFCKPQLNVVDAYRVTMANGPQRARPEDVETRRMLLASADIVAVDAAAVRILEGTPEEAEHIALGHARGVGTMDLDKVSIARIAL